MIGIAQELVGFTRLGGCKAPLSVAGAPSFSGSSTVCPPRLGVGIIPYICEINRKNVTRSAGHPEEGTRPGRERNARETSPVSNRCPRRGRPAVQGGPPHTSQYTGTSW